MSHAENILQKLRDKTCELCGKPVGPTVFGCAWCPACVGLPPQEHPENKDARRD